MLRLRRFLAHFKALGEIYRMVPSKFINSIIKHKPIWLNLAAEALAPAGAKLAGDQTGNREQGTGRQAGNRQAGREQAGRQGTGREL